jgi:hypothetical protein
MSKRQRWSKGAVLQIPLPDQGLAYAQMLDPPEFAIFDTPPETTLCAAAAVEAPVAFRVWVHKSAFNLGRWVKIGTAAIPPSLASPIPRFNQDALAPERFSIHEGGVERRSTREECSGLECAAVWDPEHVEDRIRDFRAGVPNKWVESLYPKPAA